MLAQTVAAPAAPASCTSLDSEVPGCPTPPSRHVSPSSERRMQLCVPLAAALAGSGGPQTKETCGHARGP